MFSSLIRGIEYTVKRANRSKIITGCDADCTKSDDKHPTIQLLRGMQGRRLLECTIHEAYHACQWDLAEEAVRESAAAIADVLWKDGWRRV